MPHQKTRKQRKRGLSSQTKRRRGEGGEGGPSSAYRIRDAQDILYKKAEIPSPSLSGNGKGRESVDGLPSYSKGTKDTCMQSVLRLVVQQNGARRRAGSTKIHQHVDKSTRIPYSAILRNHRFSTYPSSLPLSKIASIKILERSFPPPLSVSPSGAFLNLEWAHQTH